MVDKMRVLHGPLETANQMGTLAKGLNKNGVYCRTINMIKSYLSYEQEYQLSPIWHRGATKREVLTFLKKRCIPIFDIFDFHAGYRSFTQDYADIQLLHNEKKPMVIHHWGSEVRSLNKALKINPYAKVKEGFPPEKIDRMLRFLSSKIKYCITQDSEIHHYVKDYYEKTYVVPVMIDLDNYKVNIKKHSDRPLIVHAPTHKGIKGTDEILKVIDILSREFDFDFRLIKGYAHAEAKKLYAEADLVIDQLHLGVYGMVSIEAMAMGKPSVCYVSDFMLKHYPNDLPVINANQHTLLSVMRLVLKNRDSLPEIGKKSREFVEKRHDMMKNSLEVKKIYEEILS
ncbi:glycosyltransferase [Bacillus sp. FSL W7-1360]